MGQSCVWEVVTAVTLAIGTNGSERPTLRTALWDWEGKWWGLGGPGRRRCSREEAHFDAECFVVSAPNLLERAPGVSARSAATQSSLTMQTAEHAHAVRHRCLQSAASCSGVNTATARQMRQQTHP